MILIISYARSFRWTPPCPNFFLFSFTQNKYILITLPINWLLKKRDTNITTKSRTWTNPRIHMTTGWRKPRWRNSTKDGNIQVTTNSQNFTTQKYMNNITNWRISYGQEQKKEKNGRIHMVLPYEKLIKDRIDK